jgi:Tfp pilus assembly protein FimV
VQDATCATTMTPPYRTDGRRQAARRSRTVLAPLLWMLVLAASIICIGALPGAGEGSPAGRTAPVSIQVSPSDTLWSIADSHRLPGTTTAQMVAIIADANSLSRSGLRPGTVLRVPAQATSESAYAQATPMRPTP